MKQINEQLDRIRDIRLKVYMLAVIFVMYGDVGIREINIEKKRNSPVTVTVIFKKGRNVFTLIGTFAGDAESFSVNGITKKRIQFSYDAMDEFIQINHTVKRYIKDYFITKEKKQHVRNQKKKEKS